MEEFNLEKINPTVSRVKVKIAYAGKNRKKFDISKGVFDKMFDTLKGTPILACYIDKIGDIGGHESDIFQTDKGLIKTGVPMPYGFVDPVNEPWWEECELPDGTKKDYLFAYGYLWKKRYPKITSIIEKSGQSMEIFLQDVKMVDGYITPNKAGFLGLTALGKDVTATFEDSGFVKFSMDDFKTEYEQMYSSMSEEIGFVELKPSEKRKSKKEYFSNEEDMLVWLGKIYDEPISEEDKIEVMSCEEEFAVPDKYNHINFKPTATMQNNAKRALKKRAEKPKSQRGGTPVGLARARQLINRQTLSVSTVKRMLSYFQRHEVDKKGSTWNEYGKGRQMWDAWGGDAGFAWAKKVVNQIKKVDKKESFSKTNPTNLNWLGEIIEEGKSDADKIRDKTDDIIFDPSNYAEDANLKVSESKDELIDGTVGEKDISDIKKKAINAANRDSVIKKIFARYPETISDDITQEDIGYPLMSERDGTFYYNTGFIKAASSRIEQQKDKTYYSEVRDNIAKARAKVGMPKNFSMKGEIVLMDFNMMKDMYAKYGMNKYMFMKMADNMMYAMDMEEMKPVKMMYAMEDGMAVPMMDKMEMAEDMMYEKEDLIRMMKALHDMYMAKEQGYMAMEEEKKEAMMSAEAFSVELEAKKVELEAKNTEMNSEAEKFSAQMAEFSLFKKQMEAKDLLDHADFSMINDEHKTELLSKVSADMNMDTFKLHVKAFSFDNYKKEATKEADGGANFSMDLTIDKKKDDEPKDLYSDIQSTYFPAK